MFKITRYVGDVGFIFEADTAVGVVELYESYQRSEPKISASVATEGDDSWVASFGKVPLLPLDMPVMVKYHDGHRETALVGSFDWSSGARKRITHYRGVS